MLKLSSDTSTEVCVSPVGYTAPAYAESLSEFGVPRVLPGSGGLILQRSIPGFPYLDAMGCYPLFACRDWSQLPADLLSLRDELVTLSLVTDPFGDYDPDFLRRCFTDKVVPFKEHFVVDLKRPLESYVHRHHRRNAAQALRSVEVERLLDAAEYLDQWHELYANLIRRHRINGLTAFSKPAFAVQLSIPGLVAFRAVNEGRTVGMILWYVQQDVAYYHLGAYSDRGYELCASFALFWRAIEYFAELGLDWLNLGAGAGLDRNGVDGLTRFKRGWSTATRTAYFCGKILAPEKYAEILRARRIPAIDYFPAYRKGEFA